MTDWPKLQRDWVKLRVRLARPVRTKGGVEFAAGDEGYITSTSRGKLSIHFPGRHQGSNFIRGLRPSEVELLPIPTLRCPWCGGSRKVPVVRRAGGWGPSEKRCPDCRGSGVVIDKAAIAVAATS